MGALIVDGRKERRETPNFDQVSSLMRYVVGNHFNYAKASYLSDQQIKSMLGFRGKMDSEVGDHFDAKVLWNGKPHKIHFEASDYLKTPESSPATASEALSSASPRA
eukprot:ANDGO_03638.mRNA.1 hypothetical protein